MDTGFIPLYITKAEYSELDFKRFTTKLWKGLPTDKPYSLILFTTAFNNVHLPSKDRVRLPLTFMKLFQMIPESQRDLLTKLYIVHGSWLVKSFVEVFRKLWSQNRQIIHCRNLVDLSHYVDITKIPISLMTYIVDRTVFGGKTVSDKKYPLYGMPLLVENELPFRQFARIYNNMMSYLKNPNLNFKLSESEWQMTLRINYLDEDTRLTVSILNGCMKRDQAIYLCDFSFLEHYIILMKFLYRVSESVEPLIAIETLPSDNDWDDVDQFNAQFNNLLIFQHARRTKDGPTSGQYDYSYILIKVLKLFHTLLEKLSNEVETFEGYDKDPGGVTRRQVLRLILAYTKVLYESEAKNADEEGFDRLFKFIHATMRHYNQIRVFGTETKLEDFNNYITREDFYGFDKFKHKVLSALLQRDRDANNEHLPARKKWTNELVKPSQQLTSKLIKYTERDLIIQKERRKPQRPAQVTRIIRGRKVSELAKMYEERLF